MKSLRQNFRIWWQPPRNIADQPEHRQVTFLELFYDLVYVVLIAELSHALSAHVGWAGLGSFAFLFIIVWWAWLNGTSYHDAHGNNDIRTRVFTFLQMFSVVAMAVFAHDALGETSTGFALSYAGFQLILTYMWWRTGVYDPKHRPLSNPYSLAFLINTLLFAGSVFFPAPIRFYIWGIALVISLILPFNMLRAGRKDPEIQKQVDIISRSSPSFVERFGLFTIIVLGEVLVGVVGGVTEHHGITVLIGATATLGALIAVGLWWIYFDSVSHRKPLQNIWAVGGWMYLHLPMTMGVTVVGAAVLNVVEHAGEHLPPELRWLLVLGISGTMVSIALLTLLVRVEPENQPAIQTARRAMFVSGFLVFGLGFFSLETIPLLIISVILLLAPVFFAVPVWVQRQAQST